MPASGIQLANGVTVNPRDWEALIMARMAGPSGDERCTGALVGPRVVLTAAHCVDRGLEDLVHRAHVRIDGVRVRMQCQMHPQYAQADYLPGEPRSSQDYALCLLSWTGDPPPTLARLTFETLDISTPLIVHGPVMMTGYGCSRMWVQDGEIRTEESDGVLRVGAASIERPTTSSGPERDYVSTLASERDAALCYGDSGGPLVGGATLGDQQGLQREAGSSDQPRRTRRIVGVNSSVEPTVIARGTHGFPSDEDTVGFRSRMSALATPSFRDFVTAWLSANGNPVICGVNLTGGAGQCRD